MTTVRILKTPLDIYTTLVEYFPHAKVALTTTSDSVVATCYLSDRIQPLVLTNCVNRQSLLNEIKDVMQRIQVDMRCEEMRFYTLNSKRISLMNSLSDWQTFRRFRFEKNEGSCVRALVGYLKNPGLQGYWELLSALGLAPNQVENPSENDWKYFRGIAKHCESISSSEEKQLIGSHFKKYYPWIHSQIEQELSQENISEENNSHDYLTQLNNMVIGQPQAIKALASLLTSQESSPKTMVFLFVGPTGVGKTDLAKAVAQAKGNHRFISFPMNQYQSEMDISKFFGSSAGFVGSTDMSYFTKELNKCKPISLGVEGETQLYEITNAVILFDEFEKAHPNIKQSLLTLFDNDHHVVLSYTKGSKNVSVKYTFTKCIFINTSNLYQSQILEAFEAGLPCGQISKQFEQWNKKFPTTHSYSQELLGRFDIIPFGPIPRGECYQKLIKMKLNGLFKSWQDSCSFKEIVMDDSILPILENKLYGNGTNIRAVLRYLSRVEDAVHKYKSKWRNLKNVKLVFLEKENRLWIEVFTFIVFQDYVDMKTPIAFPEF